jgi:hypothetical protein
MTPKATRQRLAERLLDDAIIAKKRKRGEAKGKNPQLMGMRWPVERTNSWLAAYGHLRRNTDRKPIHRLAQFALAVAFMLTAKLIDGRNRWSRHVSYRLNLSELIGTNPAHHRPWRVQHDLQIPPE